MAGEEDLRRRVAETLVATWDDYWSLRAARRSRDRDDAARQSIRLMTVCGEIAHDAPEEGWRDEMLRRARVLLIELADGYALVSSEWDRGAFVGALPSYDRCVRVLYEGGLADWCSDVGFPSLVSANHMTLARRGSGSSSAVYREELDSDYDSLRACENPDWEEYDASRFLAASQLRLVVRVFSEITAYRDQMGLDYILRRRLDDVMQESLNLLAFARAHDRRWRLSGAQPEAILALRLLAAMARDMFLLHAVSATSEPHELHVLSLHALDDYLEETGLDHWIEATNAGAPRARRYPGMSSIIRAARRLGVLVRAGSRDA